MKQVVQVTPVLCDLNFVLTVFNSRIEKGIIRLTESFEKIVQMKNEPINVLFVCLGTYIQLN